MKRIHCPSARARYCRQRVLSPSRFARGSLRTIRRGKRTLIVGCPKGKFRQGRCSVGTRVQAVLYLKTSAKCRRACAR